MRLLISIIAAAILATAFIVLPGAKAQSGKVVPPKDQRAVPSPAPTPPTQGEEVDEDDTIRVSTELVTLTATVTDKKNRYVTNLKRSDFAVYEDGVHPELAYFDTGDRVPISIGILFDTSGSMVDKIDDVRDAVDHFVKSVAPGDEIFLVQFSDGADLVQDFTDDRRRILRAVEDLEPRGSTALYDAIFLGLQRIAEGKHRKKALLLVTDGNDTTSSVNRKTALEAARKSEVTIYALGIGHGQRGSFGHDIFSDPHGRQSQDQVDIKVLEAFADATGGAAYLLENAHQGKRDLIDEAAEQVAAELKQQYTLGYRPSNQKPGGSFRQIKVELPDKSLRVRTKRGYYAQREVEAR